jgi:hypothetical protein
MSMQPIVPAACMVPMKPPMGNTQAKLADSNGDDDTVSGALLRQCNIRSTIQLPQNIVGMT